MKIKNIKYVALAAVFGMGQLLVMISWIDRLKTIIINLIFTRMIPSVCRE